MKLAFLIVKKKLRNNESKSVSNGGGVSEFIFGVTFKCRDAKTVCAQYMFT